MTDVDTLAAALDALHAPKVSVHPFALVDEQTGEPVVQARSNGMAYVATYRTVQGARLGRARWGGIVVQRSTGARA